MRYGKRGLLCVCTPCYAAYHASYTLSARVMGTARANHARESARDHQLGLRVLRCVPHSPFPPKKICVFWYAWFTRMEIDVHETSVEHKEKSVSSRVSCQFPLMGLMPCPCGGAFFCLYCPTWIGGCK